jgi:arabinofuranan 3-O-arabinosyltransferase
VLAAAAWHSRTEPGFGQDSVPGYLASRGLIQIRNPYAPTAELPFVYPPSSALLLAPFTMLNGYDAAIAMLVVSAIAAALLASASTAVAGGKWTGAGAAVTMFALAGTNIGYGTVQRGNLSMVVAALTAMSVWLGLRARWGAAGLALGLGIALKPLVAPSILFLLLRGRSRGWAIALLLPAVLNAALLPVLVQPFAYLTRILPEVSRGHLLPDRFNLSLAAWGDRFHVASGVVLVAQLVVLVSAGLVCAAAARSVEAALSLTTLAAAPVLAVALISRADEPHFSLLALPLVLVLLLRRQVLSSPAAALGALLAAVPVNASLQMLGQLLLIGASALAVTNRGRRLDSAASTRVLRWWARERPFAGLLEPGGDAGLRAQRR